MEVDSKSLLEHRNGLRRSRRLCPMEMEATTTMGRTFLIDSHHGRRRAQEEMGTEEVEVEVEDRRTGTEDLEVVYHHSMEEGQTIRHTLEASPQEEAETGDSHPMEEVAVEEEVEAADREWLHSSRKTTTPWTLLCLASEMEISRSWNMGSMQSRPCSKIGSRGSV